MKVTTLNSPFGFLNGTIDVHDPEREIIKALKAENISFCIIDQLFTKPERLQLLISENVKTIAFLTTGQNAQAFFKLVDAFTAMHFVPENIILILNCTINFK